MGNIRVCLEAVGGVPYHLYGFLNIGSTYVDPVWGRDVVLVIRHAEENSGVSYIFLRQVKFKWDRR